MKAQPLVPVDQLVNAKGKLPEIRNDTLVHTWMINKLTADTEKGSVVSIEDQTSDTTLPSLAAGNARLCDV